MSKVLLDRSYCLYDKAGKAHGFACGENEVPDELMPGLEAAAKRRGAKIKVVAETTAPPSK